MSQSFNHLSLHFKSTLTRNTMLKSKNTTLMNRIKEQHIELTNLTAILSTFDMNPSREYPIIIGNASTRMSVLVLGILPPVDRYDLIKSKSIFPIGFVAKRKYKQHVECKKKGVDEKVFYMCKVDKCPYIECVCGRKYKYDEWDLFKEDTKCEDIQSMEEFFGLTYVGLVRMIEEMGDVSVYKNYEKISDRQK